MTTEINVFSIFAEALSMMKQMNDWYLLPLPEMQSDLDL